MILLFHILKQQEVNETYCFYSHFIKDVLHGRDYLRLAPSVPSRNGAIFCTTANPHKEWLIEFSFSVYGRGISGGKGMAFWYVKDPSNDGVDFFGHSSKYEGFQLDSTKDFIDINLMYRDCYTYGF